VTGPRTYLADRGVELPQHHGSRVDGGEEYIRPELDQLFGQGSLRVVAPASA
jgi:hypothetical protein